MVELLHPAARKRLADAAIPASSGAIFDITGEIVQAHLPRAKVGSMWAPIDADSETALFEVVGFRDGAALMVPHGPTRGLAPGSRVQASTRGQTMPVGEGLLGRVVDAFGEPIDDLGKLKNTSEMQIFRSPPNPMHRHVINASIQSGVRSIDALMTMGRGQRVGLLAGSGVGKSSLIGMIARGTSEDVIVLALIGERGREVRHFIEHELGGDAMKRCAVVVATSDQPAPVRMRGAYAATTIAEHFRDQGKNVLLLMDSITRFALAAREIGLAAGEPPATRGFTPSVFAAIPPLLERAGPGTNGNGNITAVYSVLAEGEDMEDPIVDHVRSIVDGHIVLTRRLANKAHFPAIDVLASLSRVMPEVAEEQHILHASRMRHDLARLRDAEDLIRLGAYVPGASAELDQAIAREPDLDAFLRQDRRDVAEFSASTTRLEEMYS